MLNEIFGTNWSGGITPRSVLPPKMLCLLKSLKILSKIDYPKIKETLRQILFSEISEILFSEIV